MEQGKNILFICNSYFISGAEISLFQLLEKGNYGDNCLLAVPQKLSPFQNIQCKICKLPFVWFYKTYNPFRILKFIYSIVLSTIIIGKIVKNNNIDIIYTNSIKSSIYGVVAKIFTRKKLIFHVRDNQKFNNLYRFIIKKCDTIISISKYIFNQFPSNLEQNCLIYGGIDINYWKPDKPVRLEDNKSNTVIIGCIGQFTRWKNQIDFIRAAKIINESGFNIEFLIAGEDLSGREKKYKNEIIQMVEDLNLISRIVFFGRINDIKNLTSQIDILIHPAIKEPFGRVLIEAMAMEKPVVAYNCGGPIEIIENEKTGYLVEPYNYQELAEKTLRLINDKELRNKMGKIGRQRVIERFNIERHVHEMEKVFKD